MRWPWQKKKPPVSFMGDLVKLNVAPGDVFVIMPKKPISEATAEALRAVWEKHFGEDSPLVVLEEGMRVGVLSPDRAAAAQKQIEEIEFASEAIDQFAKRGA